MFQGLGRLGQSTDDLSTGDYLGTDDSDDLTGLNLNTNTLAFSTPTTDDDLSPVALSTNTTPLAAVSSIPTVNSTASTTSSSGGNLLTSLLTGLGVGAATAAVSVASGAINTAALQATNAQRMASGLPPLNANGSVMTAAQMAAAGYSAAQVSAFSSQLAGDPTTLLLIAAVGIGAVLLLSGSRRGA